MSEFSKGLCDLGNGIYAYLQPDGSWGWSNAGLVVDADESLLVDTLFDLRLTEEMLQAMRRATSAAARIDTLVNTHANGDHCYGNQLVGDAVIVASKASAEEMADVSAGMMAQLLENADSLGETGAFFRKAFGAFDFSGIELVPPSQTFSGETTLQVGAKEVRLIEVGPAHTRGDVLVHVPEDRVIFTGDILFVDGTPIIWEGPVQNWIAACDRIEGLELEAIVPGHGPITDKRGVRAVRDYLGFVRDEARARYDAGMAADDAARDIALGEYSRWLDSERIAVNVHTLYREFSGSTERASALELFGLMAELAGAR